MTALHRRGDALLPQEWIATALAGFFDREGAAMTAEQRGDLAAAMALACAGIQGEVDVTLFQSTVFAPAPEASP